MAVSNIISLYPTPSSNHVCVLPDKNKPFTMCYSNLYQYHFLFTIPEDLIQNITNCPTTVVVHCAEQAIMLIKALLYKNEPIFRKIYDSNNGLECRIIGHEIEHDPNIWDINTQWTYCMPILIEKFSRTRLAKNLLSSSNNILICAELKSNWGVDMKKDDILHRIDSNSKDDLISYKNAYLDGENLLGIMLMKIRRLVSRVSYNMYDDYVDYDNYQSSYIDDSSEKIKRHYRTHANSNYHVSSDLVPPLYRYYVINKEIIHVHDDNEECVADELIFFPNLSLYFSKSKMKIISDEIKKIYNVTSLHDCPDDFKDWCIFKKNDPYAFVYELERFLGIA